MTGPWETKFGGYFDKIAVDQNQGIIYIGNGIGVGIYKSIDNGETWEPINNGLPTVPSTANYFPIIDIDVSETSAERMYLTMGHRGIFKSMHGSNWMKRNGKPGMGGFTRGTALFQGEYYILAIDSNDDNLIFAGTNDGPYKSIDGGENWEPINRNFPINPLDGSRSDINEIIRVSGTLYAISNEVQGHGIYKSIDDGKKWDIIWSPHIFRELRDLVIKTLLALFTKSIEPFTLPNILYTCLAINPKSNILYVATSRQGIYKFNETKKKWSLANDGLPFDSTGYLPIECIVVDPVKPNIIYIGTWGDGVYKSHNGGASWTPLNKELESSKVKSLALDSQQQIIYAATTNGLFKYALGRIQEAHPIIIPPLQMTPSPLTSAPAQDAPSSLLPPGTILFGSVRDFSTGSPIANAVVFLTGFYKDYSTSTDSNGMYFLTSAFHLSPQTYKVLASAEECRSQSKDVVLSSNYLQPPRADFSLQPIPPPDIEIDYSKTIVEDIVEYYSPVFYQETEIKGDHSLSGRADYITRFDFDGDWNGTTKWVSAKTNPLKAYVYYDIKQTKYYWFIYYAVYHPRDWNTAGTGNLPDSLEHEHDMEAVLLVVLKDGSLYGRLLIAESMAHDSWFNYPIDSLVLPMKKGFDADQAEFGPEICRGLSFEESYGGKHPVAYIQAEGHGIFFDQSDHFLAIFGRPYSCLTDWDKTDFHGGTGIVYRYRAEAEEPKDANDRNVSYGLLKMDELWERRNNQSALGVKSPTFEPTYDEDIKDDGRINSQAFNSNYTKEAHPPWTIPNIDSAYGLSSPIGQEFSDPVLAVASRYIGFVPQPYLSPVLTSPLEITPSPPYYVGDEINAQFTIANKGLLPITFDVLTVGGLDPDDQVADFTHRQDNRQYIALEPSESYKYKGTFALTKAGKYHFFCAYQTPEGKWNTSIDLGSGLTDKDRVKDIDVKEKEESFWPKEKVPLPKSLIVGEYFKITVKSCEFLREGNLEFDLIFENLAEVSATIGRTWTFFPERMPLVDNLGNSYPLFVLFPLEKRTLSRDTPWEFHIIFPKLKRESEAVVLYTGTSSGWGAGTGFPPESGLDYVGPIKLENIPTGKQSLPMISLPKTFLTDDKNWKIIVDSYQILEGRNLEFTLFVENLQEKIDKCKIADITFLVDNVNNKYYRNPLISVKTYKEFAPHVPTKVYVNFSEFDERAEAATLYLSFKSYEKINEGWMIGPLKIRT